MTTVRMVNEWINLYNEGYNVSKIAKYCGVTRCKVRYHLLARGVDLSYGKTFARNKFYKNKYCIGMYNLKDELVYLFDTSREMAEELGLDVSLVQQKLSRDHKFRYKKQWYKLKKIEIGEEEYDD